VLRANNKLPLERENVKSFVEIYTLIFLVVCHIIYREGEVKLATKQGFFVITAPVRNLKPFCNTGLRLKAAMAIG